VRFGGGYVRRLEGVLPNGRRDFCRQVSIWLGFVAGYQVARGLADRGSAEAFRNARRVIRVEQHLGGLPELELQRRVLLGGAGLLHAVNWTYWLAQFAVVAGGLVWIYLRRNEAYLPLRNMLIVTNTLGLVGYVLLPTAPPRLLPWRGFVDTLAESEALNHGTGMVEVLANPYAAMPSLHAADALIVGVALAATVRNRWLAALFLLWPLWVCFSLLATANHFWLDIAAGAVLAAVGALVTAALMRQRSRPAQMRAAHSSLGGRRASSMRYEVDDRSGFPRATIGAPTDASTASDGDDGVDRECPCSPPERTVREMIGEIAVVPQAEGPARLLIAKLLAEIADQGLHFEVGALGTSIEGDLEAMLGAVRAIESRLRAEGVERAVIELRVQLEPHPETLAHQVEGIALARGSTS
jgi:uncharacterized protein YqgV (UPF0045/DUF77 family)/membrane-associated phospholipid phosphatase